jgi:hypothetical protein
MNNEIQLELINDNQETPGQRKKSKFKFIPYVPILYWFFYRKPLNLLLLLVSAISGTMNIVQQNIMGNMIGSFSQKSAYSNVVLWSFHWICSIFYSLFMGKSKLTD